MAEGSEHARMRDEKQMEKKGIEGDRDEEEKGEGRKKRKTPLE